MHPDLQTVVYTLALSRHLAEGDLEGLVKIVTRTAAEALKVERVGVWLFEQDDQKLCCLALYERSNESHSQGMVLERTQFSDEFEALLSATYIETSDPLNDLRTAGYVERYVGPLGITAMLDASIRVSGRVRGAICLEHVRTPHSWQSDEIAFACQLADQLAITLLNRERAQALESLRISEERLRMALEAASDGVWDWHIPSGEVYWSDRCWTMLGYAPGELPMSRQQWERMLHPGDRAATLAAVREQMAREEGNFRVEYRIKARNGDWRWVVGRGRTMVRDAAGQPVRMVGTHTDIDTFKREELMREEIERIIRHDLKKPAINAISAARLIREDVQLEGDLDKALSVVESSGRHMIELINTSLDLFRIEAGRCDFTPEPLDCSRAVSEVMEEMTFTFPDLHARVTVCDQCSRRDKSGCPATGSRHLLRSALMNLFSNAIEASPKNSPVLVTVSDETGCRIDIRNAGAVPAAIRKDFFGKYVTFGKTGGTGLGAYSAKKMIEIQGGTIEMQASDECDSTTVTVRLPCGTR